MADPDDQVRYYSDKFGWKIARSTLVVEGELDVGYCTLANAFHQKKKSLNLLSDQFGITACGQGDQGGTDGMMERFPFIHRIAAFEAASGRPPYRFIALFDSDAPGLSAYNVIRNANKNLVECRDVFLLRRRYPPNQSDPLALKAEIEVRNHDWQNLSCEIEDLIDQALVNDFVAHQPGCLLRPAVQKNGEWHIDFKKAYKPQLLAHVTAKNDASSLDSVIQILMAFRSYCDLPPDGDPL
jgi:hypothetical protein